MRTTLFSLILLMVLGKSAIASDPGNNLQAHTYNWIIPDMKSGASPMYNSPFTRQRIQTAFDAALAQKGLVRNVQHPDLLLQFHTYTQRVRSNYMGGWGYPMWGWGGYGGYPSSRQSVEGTLILDVTDAKTGEIVWEKIVSGDVSNLNRLDKQINKGVQKLMRRFPVKQVQAS